MAPHCELFYMALSLLSSGGLVLRLPAGQGDRSADDTTTGYRQPSPAVQPHSHRPGGSFIPIVQQPHLPLDSGGPLHLLGRSYSPAVNHRQ
jgi:hypothetical protein